MCPDMINKDAHQVINIFLDVQMGQWGSVGLLLKGKGQSQQVIASADVKVNSQNTLFLTLK